MLACWTEARAWRPRGRVLLRPVVDLDIQTQELQTVANQAQLPRRSRVSKAMADKSPSGRAVHEGGILLDVVADRG